MVASCHPTFLNFTFLDIPEATTSQSFTRSCTIYSRSEYTSLLLYAEVKSRGNTLIGTSFCVAKEATSVLPKKDYKIQKIIEDINFIPHLSYLSHILGVMNLCYCYLQGPGCNIVDFAIKLTILGVGKVRLASHKRLFDPRLVVFQLFVRNTEDLFCFAIAIAFFVLHPPYSALVWSNTCFCSFISHLHLL